MNNADPSGLTPGVLAIPAAGAAGGAAAAMARYVAVVAAYAGVVYLAWQGGEWLAEQPWNPLTHPAVPVAPYCQPRVIPFPKPQPRSTPLFPPPPSKPGEICRLREQQGMFCTYECKDGVQFQTYTNTGDKDGSCPAAAARPSDK